MAKVIGVCRRTNTRGVEQSGRGWIFYEYIDVWPVPGANRRTLRLEETAPGSGVHDDPRFAFRGIPGGFNTLWHDAGKLIEHQQKNAERIYRGWPKEWPEAQPGAHDVVRTVEP